ncbi:MAG TPA: uroporphyrinogen-III C-methyltransferase [Terriglobales bacterium]|nr:uroporphyrinogen-III C-methyltransferase [Terriglobales bacterium]
MKGKVYLVGAGPGDPELLTVRAVHRLRCADVVLHDALVSPQVLALVSPSARVTNVGKRCGTKCITQAEINSLLVTLASEGNNVVRLKSGDPLLFGRAGEEIEALKNAGIEFEIVPGITSAVAAASAARISLTDRRCAEQVLLVSAHHAPGKPGPDWRSLVSPHTTIVVYMPGHHMDIAEGLMQAGLNEATPCVLISKISLPEELAYQTTLGTLRDAPALPAPSLLIVGETASSPLLPEFKSAELRNDDSTLAAK